MPIMAHIDSANNKAAIDHGSEAKTFNYSAPADLFPANGRMSRRQVVSYRQYLHAADAIRFAIEELPSQLLLGTYLEVNDRRFDSRAIRGLYDSNGYPFVRRSAT